MEAVGLGLAGWAALFVSGPLTLIGAVLGAWLLQASTRKSGVKPELIGLALFYLVGMYYIVKPLFLSAEANPMLSGWSARFLFALLVPGLALILNFLMLRLSTFFQRFYLQLLGVLMCYSGYSDTRYIFMYEPLPNGLFSDARVVASLVSWYSPEQVPRLWFIAAAVLISILNFALMFWGVRRALRNRDEERPPQNALVD